MLAGFTLTAEAGGRGTVRAKGEETLPQSVAYSSHSDSELHPCLWSSLLNNVREEKNSVDRVGRHRESSESATTAARLVGAMLCYMCDNRERKLLQVDQTEGTRPPQSVGSERRSRSRLNYLSRHALRLSNRPLWRTKNPE